MSKIASLIGLAATIVLANALDRFIVALRVQAAQTFNPVPRLWGSALANLLIATAILVLAWFSLLRQQRSKTVSVTFLVIGLFLLCGLALMLSTPAPIQTGLLSPAFDPISHLLLDVGPNSYLSFLSAFFVLIGILGLLSHKAPKATEQS